MDPHHLDAAEQRALLRIQWRLVIEAALLGAASGLVCAFAELWADAELAPAPAAAQQILTESLSIEFRSVILTNLL